jgi:phospholipid/cholesterol/gamma-HCH transport system substrate-binding protein
MTQVSENLETVSNKLKNGDGVIGTLLTDTSLTNNLSKSLENPKDGTAGFNENMEALKNNLILRRYLKKKNSKNPVNKQ